jgi:hypothetical protein
MNTSTLPATERVRGYKRRNKKEKNIRNKTTKQKDNK